MEQKVFDVNNEKDKDLLWSILPKEVEKVTPLTRFWISNDDTNFIVCAIKIKWHDKTELTRPVQDEVTEADIGKLCKFALEEPTHNINGGFGILTKIGKDENGQTLYLKDIEMWYNSCRRLTQREIKELC